MHRQLLVLFLKVLFFSECSSRHPILRSLRDTLYELDDANTEYYKTIQKYNNFKAQNDLNNNDILIIIPIEEHYKKVARINSEKQKEIDERKAIIVQKEHEARMKEIIDFMKDHMMTTIYLHEEVRRIKRTRQVRDSLREMVAYLEHPDRHAIKNMFLKLYAYALKNHRGKQLSVWDQKMNDLVINVMKDPFNDGVIN